MKKYKHLSAPERAAIMVEHPKGARIRAIAWLLGRSASTVSRELARNRDTAGDTGGSAYRLRRRHCVRPRKLAEGSALDWHVHDRLVYWR
ncbi:helix-turn-helix domain-containing protein [Ralstonia solanacearum]|uniref:helix-turn-helix domain-containing protein n=1 Tax=Ralstonia solanacearum TaxID=305 RepID=UPI000B2D85BA|nr:helix-turn-helix domain-containing protein [Ralstonia solanacearum]